MLVPRGGLREEYFAISSWWVARDAGVAPRASRFGLYCYAQYEGIRPISPRVSRLRPGRSRGGRSPGPLRSARAIQTMPTASLTRQRPPEDARRDDAALSPGRYADRLQATCSYYRPADGLDQRRTMVAWATMNRKFSSSIRRGRSFCAGCEQSDFFSGIRGPRS